MPSAICDAGSEGFWSAEPSCRSEVLSPTTDEADRVAPGVVLAGLCITGDETRDEAWLFLTCALLRCSQMLLVGIGAGDASIGEDSADWSWSGCDGIGVEAPDCERVVAGRLECERVFADNAGLDFDDRVPCEDS